MTVALVQHLGDVDFSATSTTTVLSPSSKTVTLGNTIIVSCGITKNPPAFSGCVDNLGNVYSLAESVSSTESAALYYAPVTVGGTITTITVTHASTTYRAIEASEWSGVGTFVGAAGGATNGVSTTVTFATNVTIPASGVVFGTSTNAAQVATSAGSASGSPSTTVLVEHDHVGVSYQCVTTHYAIAGGSQVSTFTGTGTTVAAQNMSGAGGIFNPGTGGGGTGTFLMLEDGSGAYELEDASGGVLLEA